MYLSRKGYKIMILFINFLLVSTSCLFAANTASDDMIRLKWSFAARVERGGGHRIIPVSKSTILHNGDQIKFYLETQADCYIYIFYYSAQGELVRLLPAENASAKLPAGTKSYLPTGTDWFVLDETSGMEKFCLLASKHKLVKIESLYSHHVSLTEPAALSASAESIFAEIKKLKRTHRNLTVSAERPVHIGGAFRQPAKTTDSSYSDIEKLAAQISFDQFYTRTVTIDHQ